MFINLILFGVVLPLVAGMAASVIGSNRPWLYVLLAAAALVFTYYLLEGMPPLPPIAVKQKLGYAVLIAGLGAAAITIWGGAKRDLLGAIFLALLFATEFYWFGGNKLARAEGLGDLAFPILHTLALTVAAALLLYASEREPAADLPIRLTAPSTLLAFAIGGAIVALLGGFIGMGQMLGGFASVCGGALLIVFRHVFIPPDEEPDLFGPTLALIAAMGSVTIVITWYATSLNLVAHSLVPATLVIGAVLCRRPLKSVPARLRPVATGAVTSIPALGAILLATF